jgi:hypothetical protein
MNKLHTLKAFNLYTFAKLFKFNEEGLFKRVILLNPFSTTAGADPDQKLTGFLTQHETATPYPTHPQHHSYSVPLFYVKTPSCSI